MDRRLQRRFVMLVQSHMRAASELAAGVASLPSVAGLLSVVQGAWRFLNNPRETLNALVQPLREVGQARVKDTRSKFVLLVHDWSKISYPRGRKRDLIQLTHETDIGHELTTALLVSADDGSPLAPMEIHLRTAEGMLSTRASAPPVQPHDRPAKKNVRNRRFRLAGEPLPLRYIVAQVRNEHGRALGTWMLLSNAPPEWASTEQLARAYYWRWNIESFFKLLKSHGQKLEHWEQETGPAIARRLLVAAMACVIVWQLHHDESPRAVQLKSILVRLSGRQMKRKKPYTMPALLSGLWTLLAMLATLEQLNLKKLRNLASAIPYLNTG